MKVNAVTLKQGNIIEVEKVLWRILKIQHVKPGKGGAFAQVEMKTLMGNTKRNKRFRSDETVEKARLDSVPMQYLYQDGDQFVFMNTENYEQFSVGKDILSELSRAFLKEGMDISIEMYEENPVFILLPEKTKVLVTQADSVVKGQTATPSYKNATLENGLDILVPPFIEAGNEIIVDTATGEYVERAKNK